MATKAPAKTTRSTKPTTTKTTARKTTRKASTKKAETKKVESKAIPSYSFPAVRGIQSGREYFSFMIPVRLLSRLFRLDTEEMPPEQRAQRKPNISRVNKLTDYVVNADYVLSSITVTLNIPSEIPINALQFEAEGTQDFGLLTVPMDANFLIADGQHRVFGLIGAVKEKPALGDETISVVLFLDTGLKRRQQIFHDLNNHVVKPNKSLNLLYDHVKPDSLIAKAVKEAVPVFQFFTDSEKTSITANSKSIKAFTFNGIAEAVSVYLNGGEARKLPDAEKEERAIAFFQTIQCTLNDWRNLHQRKIIASELRQESIVCHAITLCALAQVGHELMAKYPENNEWKEKLQQLALNRINWSKNNPDFQDLIIFGGKIRKNRTTCTAFAEWIKQNPSRLNATKQPK